MSRYIRYFNKQKLHATHRISYLTWFMKSINPINNVWKPSIQTINPEILLLFNKLLEIVFQLNLYFIRMREERIYKWPQICRHINECVFGSRTHNTHLNNNPRFFTIFPFLNIPSIYCFQQNEILEEITKNCYLISSTFLCQTALPN